MEKLKILVDCEKVRNITLHRNEKNGSFFIDCDILMQGKKQRRILKTIRGATKVYIRPQAAISDLLRLGLKQVIFKFG